MQLGILDSFTGQVSQVEHEQYSGHGTSIMRSCDTMSKTGIEPTFKYVLASDLGDLSSLRIDLHIDWGFTPWYHVGVI